MALDFTVFALLYGDHPELARRCVDSLLQLPRERVLIKLILNECSPATFSYLRSMFAANPWFDDANITRYDVNQHKYPVMRSAFYGTPIHAGLGYHGLAVQTPYVMWFDDDSFLRFPKANEVSRWPENWLDAIKNRLDDGFALLGAPYTIKLSPDQILWIQDQPWYRGRPISQPKMPFYTGGFWVARMEVLAALDYPWACLDHNGGDVMLGAALEQGRYKTGSIHNIMGTYVQKIAIINADDRGVESKAPRRGFHQKPIGYDYDPAAKAEDAQLGETLNQSSPPEPPAPPATKQARRVFRLDL